MGIGLVVVRLDALARLLGRFERHKHLAGRLGKRKLAEWKFGFFNHRLFHIDPYVFK
jgi:hypothetical protein